MKRKCDRCGRFIGKREGTFVVKVRQDQMIHRCLHCVSRQVIDCEDGIDELMWEQLMERAR